MKYWKGYGRYLRSKNPKLPIRREEFEPIRESMREHWAEIEAEMREHEEMVMKISGPTPRASMLVFLVVAEVIVIGLSVATMALTTSKITFFSALIVTVAMMWAIFQQIGRHVRSKEESPENLEEAIRLARRYYHFHLPSILRAENFDEYLQYLRMSDVSLFHDIVLPPREPA